MCFRTGRRNVRWMPVAWLALALLAACGGPPTPVYLNPEQATQTAQPSTVLPAASPVSGTRSLHLAVSSFSGFDPLAAVDGGTEQVQALVYEPLLAYDRTGALTPLLAADLPAVSADGLRWTIPLQEGVFFHDGTPFDSQAAAASLEAVRMGPADGVSWPLAALAFRQVVAGIIAEDAALIIDLQTPYPILPDLLAEPALAITRGPGIGTGPFRLFEMADGALSFAAFAPYHGGPSPLAGVQVTVLGVGHAAGLSLTELLADGTVDLAAAEGSTLDDLPPGYQHLALPTPESWLLFSRRLPPLGRVDVRLALGSPGSVQEVTPEVRVLALEHLAAAGYPDGFDATVVAAGHATGWEVLAARFASLNVNFRVESDTELALLARLYGSITSDRPVPQAFVVSWRRVWAGHYWLLLAGWDADTLPGEGNDYYGLPLLSLSRSVIVRDGLSGWSETAGGWPRITAQTATP